MSIQSTFDISTIDIRDYLDEEGSYLNEALYYHREAVISYNAASSKALSHRDANTFSDASGFDTRDDWLREIATDDAALEVHERGLKVVRQATLLLNIFPFEDTLSTRGSVLVLDMLRKAVGRGEPFERLVSSPILLPKSANDPDRHRAPKDHFERSAVTWVNDRLDSALKYFPQSVAAGVVQSHITGGLNDTVIDNVALLDLARARVCYDPITLEAPCIDMMQEKLAWFARSQIDDPRRNIMRKILVAASVTPWG